LVCNVEQVRVLRGLGSIQPGVNRCKLIADTDFEELMRDCNTSRPGRPPKRMTPITTFASMPNPDPAFLGAMSNTLQGGIPFPPPQQHRDLPPGFNPFLHLGGSPASQAAQMAQHAQAQAAMLSRNGLLPGANPRHEEMLEKYGHMLRHLQGLQKEDRGGSSPPPPASPAGSPPALNLSYRSEDDKHDEISDKSESELADIEDETEEMDDNISEDNSIEASSGNNGTGYTKKSLENGKENGLPATANTNMLHFWQNFQGQIQQMVKTAIINQKDEDESKSEDSHSQKDGHDVEKQLSVEKESLDNLRLKIEEAQKQSELYLRRFKKEKRLRRKIQSQLEIESFKKAKLEEALSTLSYKTFLQVKDLRDNETNDKENFA